jgi:hypothetical protein
MKYILITLSPEGTSQSQTEYKSLLQISKDINATYCSVYNNFLMYETPDEVKPPKKLSQLKFNKKYKVLSLE